MKLSLRLAAWIAVGALVSACAGNRPQVPDTAATGIPEDGNWFCQMSAAGEGWDCVQDPELARDPQPQRLPDATPPPESMGSPEPAMRPGRGPAAGPDIAPGFGRGEPGLAPEPEPDRPEPAPQAPPPEPAEPASRPAAEASGAVPEHVRLAYRPDSEVALTELPDDFYAVQLLAMSSKEELEAFVAREQISGMSAARVERDGKLYFVLLLGIYETADLARQAVASLPSEIGGAEPWIRPLGSLQSAMLRADSVAGSRRY